MTEVQLPFLFPFPFSLFPLSDALDEAANALDERGSC